MIKGYIKMEHQFFNVLDILTNSNALAGIFFTSINYDPLTRSIVTLYLSPNSKQLKNLVFNHFQSLKIL